MINITIKGRFEFSSEINSLKAMSKGNTYVLNSWSLYSIFSWISIHENKNIQSIKIEKDEIHLYSSFCRNNFLLDILLTMTFSKVRMELKGILIVNDNLY